MTQDAAATSLGKYTILETLYTGALSTVYRARDPNLERDVAIKVLAPHLATDPESVERFLNEARHGARLKHPNIITIFDVEQAQGQNFMVMPYMDGSPLTDVLQREGRLPTERVCRIVAQLAAALDYAHGEGLVHRDIKAGNIFLGADDRVTLMDFGLVKAASTRLTQVGTVLGTPAYMSPEQVKGEDTTRVSDIYSLGVVAYELIAGRLPFTHETAPAVLHAHVYDTPPPVSRLLPGIPSRVDGVIRKAMAKAPAARWGSAGAFAAALAMALCPTTPPIPIGTFVTQPLRPIILGIAGAVTLISLILLGAQRIGGPASGLWAELMGASGEPGNAASVPSVSGVVPSSTPVRTGGEATVLPDRRDPTQVENNRGNEATSAPALIPPSEVVQATAAAPVPTIALAATPTNNATPAGTPVQPTSPPSTTQPTAKPATQAPPTDRPTDPPSQASPQPTTPPVATVRIGPPDPTKERPTDPPQPTEPPLPW